MYLELSCRLNDLRHMTVTLSIQLLVQFLSLLVDT